MFSQLLLLDLDKNVLCVTNTSHLMPSPIVMGDSHGRLVQVNTKFHNGNCNCQKTKSCSKETQICKWNSRHKQQCLDRYRFTQIFLSFTITHHRIVHINNSVENLWYQFESGLNIISTYLISSTKMNKRLSFIEKLLQCFCVFL